MGSFLVSIMSGAFHVEAFNEKEDMIRHLFGASIMGVGGVLALGCTVGQGITGMSTLALGSIIALLSIIAGGFFGFKYLEEGTLSGAIKVLVTRN